MDAHVGLDIEMNRGGNMTIVGLTSGMAADVSGMIWEGDVLEAGYKRIVIARSLSRTNHGSSPYTCNAPSREFLQRMFISRAAVDDYPVHAVSPMKVHRLLSGPEGSQVV